MRVKPSYHLYTCICVSTLLYLINIPAFSASIGYDLATVWKYQSGNGVEAVASRLDYDDSGWEDVTLPETRKPVREGWYRLWVDIPEASSSEKNYLGSEITFSRIFGNNQIYFNGEELGKQTGWGISAKERPVSYVIPPRLIKFGQRNLIVIHIKGFGGKQGTGVTGPVLAMAPLGGVWLTQRLQQTEEQYASFLGRYPGAEYGKTKSAKILQGIEKILAKTRNAQSSCQWGTMYQLLNQLEEKIPAAEKDIDSYWEKRDTGIRSVTEAPEGWRESSPGFGILGRLYNDGLLTVNSDPAGFSMPYGPGGSCRVDYEGITPTHIWKKRMNWMSKTVAVEDTHKGKPTSYEVTHSVAFPGVMVKVFDKEFSFTLSTPSSMGPDYLGYSTGIKRSITIPITDKQGNLSESILLNPDKSKIPMQRNWLIFWAKTGNQGVETYPLQLCFEYPLEEVTFAKNDEGKTVITLKSRQSLGNIIFLYPLGIESGQQAFGQWKDMGIPVDFSGVCDFWGYASRQIPLGCREFYKVEESQGFVDIFDQYEYLYLDDEWNAGRLLLTPIPPVLSQAVLHKYPVQFSQQGGQSLPAGVEFNRIKSGLNFLMKTKYGEYGTFIGTPQLHYRLPIPPLDENAVLKDEAVNPELENLINQSVKELGYTEAANGVDKAYKGNAQAWMAYPYLNPENRTKLWNSSTTATLQAFQDELWTREIEPFSKAPYLWTYYLEGPYYGLYDVDWGNGLTLYGFQKYASYSGDWKSVQNHWAFMKKVFRYFSLSDSWVWMSATNADLGHGTGAGDCLCSSYAACLSMARMAKVMKDIPQREEALYLLSKTAVPALTRFWLKDYAEKEGMLDSGQYPIGYFEEEGILTISPSDDPWYMTSMISGNGVEPEIFNLYMKYAPETLKQYEKDFEERYPHWDEGDYQYGRKLTYPDNSGYTTIPHLYNRFRLGDSKESLNTSLAKASRTQKMWWTAPGVLAEMAASEIPLKVADWSPAQWLGGEVSAGYKEADLYFRWGASETAGFSEYFKSKNKGYDRSLEFSTRYRPYEVTCVALEPTNKATGLLSKIETSEQKTLIRLFQPEGFTGKVKVSFKFYQ